MRSKRLSRQLKKAFGEESPGLSLAAQLASSDIAISEDALRRFASAFPEFLEHVQKAYDEMEEKVTIAQRSVEVSNAELTEVNANLFELNKTFQAMIDSLAQGFFIFGADGICLPVHTKSCETLLENVPAGKAASEVLGIAPDKQDYFERWRDLLFREVIEFAEIASAGPSTYTHSKNLSIAIEYKPVRDANGKVEYVVAIITDRTNEVRAKNEASEMHAFAVLVSSIMRDKEQFRRYVHSARRLIAEVRATIDLATLTNDELTILKRQLHTLKGAASSFGMVRVKEAAHDLESKIGQESDRRLIHAELIKGFPAISQLFESTLLMHADVLGDALTESDPVREIPLPVLMEFDQTLANLGSAGQHARLKFQTEIISVPVAKVFESFDRTLQDLASSLEKTIAPIEMTGGELRIRPEPLTNLLSSLVHIFRNIADHGIESESERSAAGKDPDGRVRMQFESVTVDGQTYLRMKIADDGHGIDVKRLRDRLAKRGLSGAELSDQDVMKTIFESGMTTANGVTEFSGRGEGLAAVKDDVEVLGGTIAVESVFGQGTTFVIQLPNVLVSEVVPSHLSAA